MAKILLVNMTEEDEKHLKERNIAIFVIKNIKLMMNLLEIIVMLWVSIVVLLIKFVI